MSDDTKRKPSHAPINAPAPANTAQVPNRKNQRFNSPISSKKQLKKAKKTKRSAISVRGLITGLFILIATAIAVTAVTSPDILTKITAGEIIERTEICTITETNASLYFDTTCGKFEWNTVRQPGTPKNNLVEGETYRIESSGVRIGIAKQFPSVIAYDKAAV